MIPATVSKVSPGETVGVPTYEGGEREPTGWTNERIIDKCVKVTQGHQSVYITRETYREIKRMLGK